MLSCDNEAVKSNILLRVKIRANEAGAKKKTASRLSYKVTNFYYRRNMQSSPSRYIDSFISLKNTHVESFTHRRLCVDNLFNIELRVPAPCDSFENSRLLVACPRGRKTAKTIKILTSTTDEDGAACI